MALVFITGSTDGLGRAAALSLLQAGHQVVLHARSEDRAATLGEVASRASGIVLGDLRSAVQTRSIADQVNGIGRMDAVIHNAGVYMEASRRSSRIGHAGVLAVNTLAPYILTALIHRPARLVYLSSGLHRGGEGSLRDLDWTKRAWDPAKAYAESKLQVVALAFAVARLWPQTFSNAVDPGWVRTKMGGPAAPVDLDTGQRTQTWLPPHHDLDRIVRQRSLQRLRLIPRRAHPDVSLLISQQDHRHCLGMDRLDDGVR
jgi:NAD(P)-dependent dehydrogenase (short-subunit alcohol dehydrogenase family)